MYSFAQRADTTVLDEPLYAHYLMHQPTEAVHPGRADVIASQDRDGDRVAHRLVSYDYGTPILVCKQMTHHLVGIDDSFLQSMDNVLLIRDPTEIVASFSKVVNEVTAMDIGIPQQTTLFGQLIIAGRPPTVIDARRLLEDPRGVLTRLCDRLGIEFTEAMLSWPTGPKPFDGSWAEHWYDGVHRSTGFNAYQSREIELSPTLSRIAAECEAGYRHLLSHAL